MNTYPVKSWHILVLLTPVVIGAWANTLAILLNGGTPSPLKPSDVPTHIGVPYSFSDRVATLLTSHTRLAFLADKIPVKSMYFSIGDLIILSFVPLYVGFTIFWIRRKISWQKS